MHTQTDESQDIFPYDADGQPLRDVRLYNRDGHGITYRGGCGNWFEPRNAFPRCPEQAPFTVPGTNRTRTPTATPSPSATR